MLETLAVWYGRNVTLRGSERVLSSLYPCNRGSRRFVRGLRRRGDGLIMEIDSRNWIDWNLIFRGTFEPHVTLLLERLLSAGDVAIDVGANIGAHTLTLARTAGPSGTVLAFEPNPLTRAVLRRNVELNSLSAVSVSECALGAKCEVLPLRVPRADSPEYSNLGLASLVALATPHDLVDVQVRTLDEVADERGLTRIDLVKIDVQGYECEVLEGMRRLLEVHDLAVVLEYEDWAWAEAGSDILRLNGLLLKHGYRLWTIGEGRNPLTPLVDFRGLPPHADLLALKAKDPRAQALS